MCPLRPYALDLAQQRKHARSLFALFEILGCQQFLPPGQQHWCRACHHVVGPSEKIAYTSEPSAGMPVEAGTNFDVNVHGVGLNHIPGLSGGKPITAGAVTMHRPLLVACNSNRSCKP